MSSLKGNEKKITWSKGSLLATGIVFVAVLGLVFYIYTSTDVSSMYDTALLATVVSVSGAIFGSNLCWYSKKAASENQYKLRMSLYEDSTRVRLDYNEKMINLMQKYNLSREEIMEIDNSGDIDEMMDSALNNVVSGLDENQSEFDSSNQMENFSL